MQLPDEDVTLYKLITFYSYSLDAAHNPRFLALDPEEDEISIGVTDKGISGQVVRGKLGILDFGGSTDRKGH